MRDLGISDTAMGPLHGIAFALFCCALGVPIARLREIEARMGRAETALVNRQLRRRGR